MSDQTRPAKAVRETVSFRLPAGVVDRLDAHATLLGITRTTLAEQYLEEGLRIVDHPGIRFADGTAGRRAAVVGGPDVWEIVLVLKANAGNVAEVAQLLALTPARIEAAVRYYAVYTDEIDDLLARNEAAFDREADIAARRAGLFG